MKNSTKILLGAVGVTVVVCVLLVVFTSGGNRKPEVTEPLPDVTDTTPYFDIDPTDDTYSVTEPTELTTEKPDLSKLILGKWMDSANMSGYEFFEGGRVTVTYVNLTVPFINLPINGTANGTYTLTDDEMTIKYSIYTGTIERRYFVDVSMNELTLQNRADGDKATYQRVDNMVAPSVPNKGNDDLIGAWVNADASMRYIFADDATVGITFVGYRNKDISSKEITGSYTGIYVVQGNFLTIQFIREGETVTLEYTFSLTSNTMTLTDKHNNTLLFVRGGTGGSTYASEEDLRGTWRDGTGSSGYTFNEGGIVDITYVDFNIPVLNMPITGSYKGTYQLEGDRLTIRYSIRGSAVTEVYGYRLEGNSLTLTNAETGEQKVYTR